MFALFSAVFQALGQVSSAQSARKFGVAPTLAFASLTASIVVASVFGLFGTDKSVSLVSGTLAGLAGLVGLLVLLAAFRKIAVAVASAVVAASSAIVISGWDLLNGSQASATQFSALVLCLASLALLFKVTDNRSFGSGALLAVLAGAAFGTYVIYLSFSPSGQLELGTLLVARVVIATPICLFVLIQNCSKKSSLNAPRLAFFSGAMDAAGNLFLLLALQFDNLLLVGTMAAVVPVISGAIAAIGLREKLNTRQIVALCVAVAGAALAAI
ncbi:MAG: hypothetical protein RL044_1007 [Actinomycetota bacterium]